MRATGQKLFADLGKGLAWIVTENAGGKIGDVTLTLVNLATDGSFRTKNKIIESLGAAVNHG
jgi:hypothetical protein